MATLVVHPLRRRSLASREYTLHLPMTWKCSVPDPDSVCLLVFLSVLAESSHGLWLILGEEISQLALVVLPRSVFDYFPLLGYLLYFWKLNGVRLEKFLGSV